MTILGIWLIAVGVCDLLRARRDRVGTKQVWTIAAAAVLALLALVVMVDPASSVTVGVVVASAAGLVVYVVASAAALNHQGRRGGDFERRVALGALAGSVLLLLVTSGRTRVDGGLAQRWYDGLQITPLDGVLLETFLVGIGLFVFQFASANIVVRMVLDGVGTPAESNEQTLKGGRLLGPMERVFILALGMAGHVTAASIVIAAKGLLRYPELRSNTLTGNDRAEVSEYFLVGSFLSWLIAMAGLPLV